MALPPPAWSDDLPRITELLRLAVARLRASNRRLRTALALAGPAPAPVSWHDRDELRLARAIAGLSQRELAAALCYSRSFIAEAECGRRRVPARLAAWAQQTVAAAEWRAGAGR